MINPMYSQKYTIVQFLTPVEDDYEFAMEDWSLHTTLADVFSIDLSDQLIKALNEFVENHETVVTHAIKDSQLGSNDNPINVILLEKNNQLQSLHDELVNLLAEHGAVFNTPEYTHNGFLPHSTAQTSARMNVGDELVIDKLTLVDMFVNNDWRRRKVLKTFELRKG